MLGTLYLCLGYMMAARSKYPERHWIGPSSAFLMLAGSIYVAEALAVGHITTQSKLYIYIHKTCMVAAEWCVFFGFGLSLRQWLTQESHKPIAFWILLTVLWCMFGSLVLITIGEMGWLAQPNSVFVASSFMAAISSLVLASDYHFLRIPRVAGFLSLTSILGFVSATVEHSTFGFNVVVAAHCLVALAYAFIAPMLCWQDYLKISSLSRAGQ